MKYIKIIAGAVLCIASIVTLSSMLGEEHGAGLGGALTGFILLMGIGIWLIYSGAKK